MSAKRTRSKKGRSKKARARDESATQRLETQARRAFCTGMGFARLCPDGRCRRVQACTGDPNRCFGLFWPRVREEDKVWIRTAIKLRTDGLPAELAIKESDARVARFKAEQAEREAAAANAAALATEIDPEAALELLPAEPKEG